MPDEVIIHEPGSLTCFPTLEAAARKMEPVNVRTSERKAWQQGRWLRTTVEHVVLRPTDVDDAEGLLAAVVTTLAHFRVEPPDSLDEATATWKRVDADARG